MGVMILGRIRGVSLVWCWSLLRKEVWLLLLCIWYLGWVCLMVYWCLVWFRYSILVVRLLLCRVLMFGLLVVRVCNVVMGRGRVVGLLKV